MVLGADFLDRGDEARQKDQKETKRMDVHKILVELRAERDRIDSAIEVMEELAQGGGGKRRGRPPKWLKEAREKADHARQGITPEWSKKFRQGKAKKKA